MFSRISHIVTKEFIRLWRDKWGRFWLIVPPIIQLLLFGYAATFEVYHVSTAVLDLDHTQEAATWSPLHFEQSAQHRPARANARADRCGDRPQRCGGRPRHPCRLRQPAAQRPGGAAPGTGRRDQFEHGADRAGLHQHHRRQFSQDYVADLAERTLGIQGVQQQVQVRSSSGPGSTRISTVNGSSCRRNRDITLVMVVNLTVSRSCASARSAP